MKNMILGSMLALVLSQLCACGYKSDLVLPDDPDFKDRVRFPDVLLPSKTTPAASKP
jgi:predicted small lipoprotein YifL